MVLILLVRIPISSGAGAGPPEWTVNTADSPDPVNAGSTITYTGTCTDPKSDDYWLTVCLTDSISNGGPGTCASAGDTLCASGVTTSGSQATCQYVTDSADVGTLTAYGYCCDNSNGCSPSTSTTTTVNAVSPSWSSSLADSPDPLGYGSTLTYTGTGTDPQSDQYRMTVCTTDSISNGYPGTCSGTTLCTSSATNSASQASCTYDTVIGDIGTLTAYAFLCDSGSSTCSASTSTSTTVQDIKPSWTANLADSPDPRTEGQTVTYTGTGTDPQSDQYRMTVCKTDSISNGYPGTCTGTTLCTSSATNSASQASCDYVTQGSDIGTLTAYAFLCDSGSSTCTASTSTTTTVDPSYGTLSVVIDYPSDNYLLTRHETFRLNATVTCTGAGTTCGTVSAYARYNNSGTSADTSISTTPGATPLFLASGVNPQTNAMSGGDTWKVSFILNGTSPDVNKELDVLTTSSSGSGNVPDANSADITVSINDLPPIVTTPLLAPSIIRANNKAIANTTYTDAESDSGTVYFRWYVNNILVYTTTNSSVASGTLVKASLYQGNYSTDDILNVSVYANDGDNVSSTKWSLTSTIYPQGVSYSNYDGATTDFNNLPDTENVNQPVIEKTGFGKIVWKGSGLNVSGADFDSYSSITANSVSVDSANLNPDLNSPANITFYGLTYQQNPLIYKDGALCDNLCSFISYSSGTLKFNVSGFSSYTSGVNSQVDVWDETDSGKPYAGQYKFINDTVLFFANYTNITSGAPVQGGGTSCTINFGSGWTSMTFNSTKSLYQYNRSFTSDGTFYYNISCDGTSLNFEELNISDSAYILDPATSKFWNGTFDTSGGAVGQWNISSMGIASWFFGYILDDGRNFTLEASNTAPRVTAISLTPASPNTTSDISCNATIIDAEQGSLTVEYWWYNSTTLKFSGNKTGVQNNTNTIITTLGSGNTSKGETWNCTIRAYDSMLYSGYNSTDVLVANLPPTKPVLATPTEGNITVHDRTPYFAWNSTDIDGDEINYTFNISYSSNFECGPNATISVEDAEYTPTDDQCVDQMIFWQVMASDGEDDGEWSDLWNFTIESYLSLELTTPTVDFGTLNMLEVKDTDNDALPLIVENTGNIIADIAKISANASLWVRQPLGTKYLQFKADNTAETGSFNYSDSVTDWENMTSVDIMNMTIIKLLDYNDTHDEAQIDLRVEVPINEPPGTKKITVYVIGEQS